MMSDGDFKCLKAKGPESGEYFYIERCGSGLLLDCSADHRGNRHYYELPRSFQNARAAKGYASKLAGERLVWSEMSHT